MLGFFFKWFSKNSHWDKMKSGPILLLYITTNNNNNHKMNKYKVFSMKHTAAKNLINKLLLVYLFVQFGYYKLHIAFNNVKNF